MTVLIRILLQRIIQTFANEILQLHYGISHNGIIFTDYLSIENESTHTNSRVCIHRTIRFDQTNSQILKKYVVRLEESVPSSDCASIAPFFYRISNEAMGLSVWSFWTMNKLSTLTISFSSSFTAIESGVRV